MTPSSPVRLVLSVVLYLGLALAIATFSLTARVILAFPGDAVLPAECGLVFGAAVHRTDDPGPGIMRRTSTAARLVHEGMVERLIFTGGRGAASNESEAAVMRGVAMRKGIDPDVITLEEQAASTWENLVYARPLVSGCRSIVGISDRYHLARIQYLADLQGWGKLTVFPADNPPNRLFMIRSVTREVIALLYYMVVGAYA